MGYTRTQNRMHCHRRLPKKNAPLMESENTKAGEPSPAATTSPGGPSDPAPTSSRHHEVTDLLAMSNVSEEEEEEKEEVSSSQDISLLFVVEEQSWSTFGYSPLEKETSVDVESRQQGPRSLTGLSERESNFGVQEVNQQNPSLDFYRGECTADYSSRGHQSSLSGSTPLEQDSTPLTQAAVEQLQGLAIPAGFPQALDCNDTLLQTQYDKAVRTDSLPTQEESVCRCPLLNHRIAKCHQNAESSKSRSNEEQPGELEAQQGFAHKMEAQGGSSDEMSSKIDRGARVQPSLSSANEGNIGEVMGQKDDMTCFASHKCSELSKGRRINLDVTQAKPTPTLSPSPSKTADNHSDTGQEVEDLEEKSILSSIRRLWKEDEMEDNTGRNEIRSSLKEEIQTKHVQSNANGRELESTQKELEKPELEKMEVSELEDISTEEEEENLDWDEMKNATKTEQEWPELDQESNQERDMKVQTTIREERQKEGPVQSFRPGLETLNDLENGSVVPEFSNNHSCLESEGLTFPLKELFPLGACPESAFILLEPHEQTTKANVVLVSKSPKAQPDAGQWEYSGGRDHTYLVPHSRQDSDKTEGSRNECKENVKEGESERTLGGEGMTLLVEDLAVTPESHDLHDSQLVKHPVDGEGHVLASTPGIISVTDSVQRDASKGAKDSTVDYAMVEEEPDSIQELLGIAVSREASGQSSDFTDTQIHHEQATASIDFHEETDSSVPRSLQTTLPSLDLLNIDKESVEVNPISSLTSMDPELLQAQDAGVNDLEKFQQHLVFPNKEVEGETLYVDKNHLPGLVALEEQRTECEHSSESPSSSNTCIATAGESPIPLSSVPVPDQTDTHETVFSQFIQSSPLALDCGQSAWLEIPPPDANLHAQPPCLNLDPKHPAQPLELLPSSNQTDHLLTIQPTSVPVFSAPTLDVEASVVPLVSELGPNQLPDQVFTFDCSPSLEYGAKHPESLPVLLPQSNLSVCPAPNANQSLEPFITNASQMREATAPELNVSLFLPQLPVFDFNTDLPNLPPASSFSVPPTIGDNQSAQQPVESNTCLAGVAQIPTSLATDNPVTQTSPSVLEAKSRTQILRAHGRTEETTPVHLANMEVGRAPQGHGNTLRDSGVSPLVTHSNLASALDPSCTLEETVNITDKYNGKSLSDHSPQPSLGCQEMPEAVEGRSSMQSPPLLAFNNPIYFLQLGPPSPPTIRRSRKQHAISQGPQWQQTADARVDAVDSTVTQQMTEGIGRLWKGLEKPEAETIPPALPRKERTAKHPPLEKSISCPNRNVMRLEAKDPEHNAKAQEILAKIRTKSKDWHRLGVRKVSIPTENPFEVIAHIVPPRNYTPAHKDPPDHMDRALQGEKKSAETVENIKRRHSKLINSSRLLYQEYSDVALNKAIQNQKRADSLSEELEQVSPGFRSSPKLRRKVLSSQDSCLQRLSVSSSASLWQDIPMVRGSTMLLSMTHEEQKLQEAKFELIASEASYLRSLNVAVDHFQHSSELQAVLSNQDKQWLFSRLQDVRDVSANFLFDLEEKLEENMFTFNVCDVALKHAPEFRRVYLPYVTNQTYQEQTFRRLLNGVPAFQQVLEKLESDPICQRLSLKSFLILPFQRITRLKLLLQNILKRTRPGADEEVQATQAYDALEKLIKDCNENVQRMKNTEELIYLSQNMEFECKIFPLISQSRRLVKRGELTALEYNLSLKWKLTTRPIYLHLFNDFLLLSRPRENGHFIVFDYAASSEVRGEKCEMKLHGANKNVFRLFLLQNHQGKKVEFLFRTETQSEKLRWISALSPQQAEPDLLDDSDAPQVQCMKSYKARENDELALEKADIVMVLQQSIDGWIEGVKLSDGERGWFPSEQMEFISSRHARQMNLKEEQRVKNAKQQVFRRK
ncbi:rho guanine nucleotide exchange factor 5 [Sphaerodactylus townsendi]|nr:rho guanine nucleotide exchange factor 5 [Sphaerodactylus townsendi]